MTTEHDHDDAPMDPAESLRLIADQRARASRNLTPDARLLLWPWGVAWLVGFGLFFLRFGPGGRVFVAMPEWLPVTSLVALMLIAGAFSGIVGARSARQISGPSSNQGALYGITWAVAFTGLSLVLARITELVPEP